MKKLEVIKFLNPQARDYPEFRAAAREMLFNCHSPIATTECKESTADKLRKIIRILNKNGVEVIIESMNWKGEEAGYMNVKIQKWHIKHQHTFTEWREKIRDLEIYFLEEMLYFAD